MPRTHKNFKTGSSWGFPVEMHSFGITKRKDEEKFGAFRTKELILAAYDAMRGASMRLNAQPSVFHGA